MKLIELLERKAPLDTFTHDGRKYDLDEVKKLVAKEKVQKFPVGKLAWILDFTTVDEKRILKVDMKQPVLVVVWQGQYVVVDGAHRLTKAVRDGIKELPGKYVPDLVLCKTRVD